jgi:uncharacterized protein (TIGR02145 family)
MQNKDLHNFLSLNTDDRPEDLQPGDITDALNFRLGSSKDQHGIGIAETLQSEVEVLIGVAAGITYYGEAIGGEFIYEGFEEIQIGSKVVMKKNWDGEYPGSKVYDDDEANASVYGRLYTHGQIMSADFCPAGWHIPTEAEFDDILTELGGEMLAGGKMKEVGTEHWALPNTGATDSSGFRAIPGGKFDLLFELLGSACILWLQDEAVPTNPIASPATAINYTEFIANWILDNGVDGYYLDIATDLAFTAFVAGYNNKDVAKVSSFQVTGLASNIPYYYRVRAYNEIGSSLNSNTIVLTTIRDSSIYDIDGNEYSSIIIGSQEWLVENLKTTKYADGTLIPNLTDNGDWQVDNVGAYCYHGNNIANKADYGALYNWYAVVNAHGLAPSGFRIPSYADWNTLITELGGASVAGGKLKEIGLTHWLTPNTGATDLYAFAGRGADYRYIDGAFSLPFDHRVNYLWASDESPIFPSNGLAKFLLFDSAEIGGDNNGNVKTYGFSVRCMRDV